MAVPVLGPWFIFPRNKYFIALCLNSVNTWLFLFGFMMGARAFWTV